MCRPERICSGYCFFNGLRRAASARKFFAFSASSAGRLAMNARLRGAFAFFASSLSRDIHPDAAADSPERRLYDWLDTDAGQDCIKKSGYVAVGPQTTVTIVD